MWFETFISHPIVVALFSVGLGTCIAALTYRDQKKLDKEFEIKNQICDSLAELHSSVVRVLLLIDRTINSRILGTRSPEETLEYSLENEMKTMHQLICEDMPILFHKIEALIDVHFGENERVVCAWKDLESAYRIWSDAIVYVRYRMDIRVDNQPALSRENIVLSLKALRNLVWDSYIIRY